MKTTQKKYVLFTAILVVLLVAFAFSLLFSGGTIPLAQYKWKVISQNQSLILDKVGNTVVGPGNIELYAKYPFIIGTILANGVVTHFAIDISKDKVAFIPQVEYLSFMKRNEIDVTSNQYVTFYDLRGQHASSEKLTKLQENLKSQVSE